ncbi:MAG: hydantoinase/oxoprolinase N-terminal domain-containing protein, partial [Sideroxyarcus sp.]|nr:hydantoinase/oxoprolinase N-terminal domain-containing protein [Sideroxyarcus sp.]
MYRIGVDVGGTNTDAVIMRGRSLVAWAKAPTTREMTNGISEALATVTEKAGIGCADVGSVMIGTTHFTNAVVERKHLQPVAAIRIGLPATACLPPMVDWPDDLREVVGNHGYLVRGGHEYDGREIAPLDIDEIDRIADDIKRKGIAA